MVRAERPILSVILAAYLGLALWYGVVTPILEPYDEPKHFGFVLSLALDHGLPVQDPTQDRRVRTARSVPAEQLDRRRDDGVGVQRLEQDARVEGDAPQHTFRKPVGTGDVDAVPLRAQVLRLTRDGFSRIDLQP